VVIGGRWSGWENLGGGLDLSHGPECLSRKVGIIDCIATARSQNNSSLEKRITFDAVFKPWESVSGINPAVFDTAVNTAFDNQHPSCVSISSERIDCFVLGTSDGTQSLFHTWQDGAARGWWEDVGLGDVPTSYPSCVAASSSKIMCFTRASDGSMRARTWNSQVWASTSLAGNLAVGTAPVCVAWRTGPFAADSKTTCVVESPNGSSLVLRSLTLTPASVGGWVDIRMADTTLISRGTTSIRFPDEPKCVTSGVILFCVAWTFKSDGTPMLARWSTRDGQNWTVWDDLADDRGTSDPSLLSKFGSPIASTFDCVPRGAGHVDCVEVVLRSMSQSSPGSTSQSLHLRAGGWNGTALATWATIERVTSPVQVVSESSRMQVRCVAQNADSLDCFTVTNTKGPMLHASFRTIKPAR
jgi:hypothetical protein